MSPNGRFLKFLVFRPLAAIVVPQPSRSSTRHNDAGCHNFSLRNSFGYLLFRRPRPTQFTDAFVTLQGLHPSRLPTSSSISRDGEATS